MIELIVLDVDGTMTSGAITYSNSGEEFKSFCVKDGLAIASWIALGKEVAIITGRESKIVENRAKELGIKHFYQKIKQKDKKLEEILQNLNLTWQNVAAIGDDLNDYSMLKKAQISFAPADAVGFVKENVNVSLNKNGGNGAVREMIDYIIKHNNMQKEFLDLWVKK